MGLGTGIAFGQELGGELGNNVTVCDVPFPECEIYSPCAVGATLNPNP